jgi:hypothetical protein
MSVKDHAHEGSSIVTSVPCPGLLLEVITLEANKAMPLRRTFYCDRSKTFHLNSILSVKLGKFFLE